MRHSRVSGRRSVSYTHLDVYKRQDLPRLAFTRRVVEESMRLYPAAPGISTRVALEDDVISGQKIPKGMSIAILPWVLHRHRKLWHEPERFDPDRFLPERSLGRPRFAFLPFGAGPRAVSYTHLDVYKRQAMCRVVMA